MTITVGIPSKGINPSTIRVIQEAIRQNHVTQILVSINPGLDNFSIPQSISADPRVRIVFQEEDLGLYGNFRYLVGASTSEKFMWLCTDDSPTADLHILSGAMDVTGSLLAIPTWNWAEYRPKICSFDKEYKPGVYPPTKISKRTIGNAIYPEPSWIFGLWNLSFLRRIMPRLDFDWLDVYLLQVALLSERVLYVRTESTMTIGTWEWAGKLPNSITLTGPHAFKAVIYQIRLMPKFFKYGIKSFLIAGGRIQTIVFQARKYRKLRRRNHGQ